MLLAFPVAHRHYSLCSNIVRNSFAMRFCPISPIIIICQVKFVGGSSQLHSKSRQFFFIGMLAEIHVACCCPFQIDCCCLLSLQTIVPTIIFVHDSVDVFFVYRLCSIESESKSMADIWVHFSWVCVCVCGCMWLAVCPLPVLLERIERQQLFQHFCLRRFPYLAGQEHFVHHRIHLVEVEHQIQFAHIVEVFVEYLYEIMYGFQVTQIVVVHIDTYAEVQTSIASVDDFEIPELKTRSARARPKHTTWLVKSKQSVSIE